MIMIRIIAFHAATRAWSAAAVLLAAVASLPSSASAAAPPAETIAEAMFLCDALPPGGRDLNLAVTVAPVVDPATGASAFVSSPRMQLALALGERLGFTADVGLGTNGAALDAPGASLKFLLRAPEPGRTGFALSADLYGGSHDPVASEAGFGFGAIRSFGRVTLRAGATVATRVSEYTPHGHGGLSAALALGARWRLLGEVVGMTSGRDASLAAGPSVKVALGESASLAAGVLVPLAPAPPTFTIQVTHGI